MAAGGHQWTTAGLGGLLVICTFLLIFNIIPETRRISIRSISPASISPQKKQKVENSLERIHRVCTEHGNKLHLRSELFRRQLMLDDKHKIAYCRHGKVGTTTWMKHFIRLLPESTQDALQLHQLNSHQLHVQLPLQFKDKGQALDSYFFFSFVRHPFDRLISAFKDKVLSQDDKSYSYVSASIRNLFGRVSFENFLRYVIRDLERQERCNDGQGQDEKKCNHQVDVHWRPYYQRCAYCDVDYDFIGRLETFNQDVRQVVIKANLTRSIPVEETSLQSHSTSSEKSSQETIEFDLNGDIKATSRALDYFSSVDDDVIDQLKEYYSPDFQLFQYSLEGF